MRSAPQWLYSFSQKNLNLRGDGVGCIVLSNSLQPIRGRARRADTAHNSSISPFARPQLRRQDPKEVEGQRRGGGSAILDEEQLLLETLTSQLDYRYINDIIDIPTDENIARWLFKGINSERLDFAGIQSTPSQGVNLDSSGNAHLWRKFRFEAAHQLPKVRPEHKCGRMHGHGFEVIIHAIQDISSQ